MNYTKALGHAIGGGKDIRGCKSVPTAWKNLYMGIVNRKTLAAAKKLQHHEKFSISLEEKEQDAQELYQQHKETIRTKRYKGSIPTESVDITNSPGGDLSTLTSHKPMASGKFLFLSSAFVLFSPFTKLSFFVLLYAMNKGGSKPRI